MWHIMYIHVCSIQQVCFSSADLFGSLTGFSWEFECFTDHFTVRLSGAEGSPWLDYLFSAGSTCQTPNGTKVWECGIDVCCPVY